MTSADRPAEHELDAPPWRRVEMTLMATSRAIRRAYDRRLDDIGLNLSEASLLAFVDEHGPTTQTVIAERIGMGRASAGSMIDALERRNLLSRRSDRTDRRAWRVELTQSGRRLVERVSAVDEQLREDLRAGITRAERRELANVLLRLQTNLGRILS
jgi:DNA-binding MarR family transcriptional regulator